MPPGPRSRGAGRSSTLLRVSILRFPAPPSTRAGQRVPSLDAVRGLAVVGMLLVNNAGVDGALPGQLVHGRGGRLTLADLVFPLFLFVVGVGMSRAPRVPPARVVLRRCGLLFLLGCLLVSAKYRHLAPSMGVLQHIAIASLAAWAVLRLPRRSQPWVGGGALLSAWLLPTYAALPGTVAGSWDAGTTLSAAVERLLTGHVGREQVVASVVSGLTVLAGVAAGRAVQHDDGARRVLFGAALGGTAGLLLSRDVPLDKTLWTPSYVLVTAAVCAALHVAAVLVLDRACAPGWALPLRVLGANAIVLYVATTLLYSAVLAPVRDQLVLPLRMLAGDTVAAVAYAASSVAVGYALCAWLWRRDTFVTL